MRNVYDVLEERGFVDQVAGEDLKELLSKPTCVYLGIDATAKSAHLGNFMGIMVLRHLIRHGHQVILLSGGATTMIGDPSGKSVERPLLSPEEIRANVVSMRKSMEPLLDVKGAKKPLFLNNIDWFEKMSMIDYLRDVGKFFRMGTMIAKESVKTRLNSDEGMSFTEFSYQTLQGYDFFHLNQAYNTMVQVGGSDQFGNITAGIQCTKRKSGNSVYGLAFPLLTRSDGKKFGKSEEGALWLDRELLSPYALYQYLYKIPDSDVIKMMKFLTEIEMKEIALIEKSMQSSDYRANDAQERLATEVVRIIHGEEGLSEALKGTRAMVFGKGSQLDPQALLEAMKELPSAEMPRADIVGQLVLDSLVKVGLVSSKGEARRLILQGGVSLNQKKISDPKDVIEETHLLDGNVVLVRIGKKKSLVIKCL